MRRPVLLSVALLGLLVCLIGGAGLFAALTDTARTGTNQVDSAALAASADIRLATSNAGDPFVCGTFSEDLSTGLFTASNVSVGYLSGLSWLCIKNVGSQPVSIWASIDEMVDTDIACTGDETLHGDTTCGSNQLGELSTVLNVNYTRWNCAGTDGSGFGSTFTINSVTPGALPGSLAPDETGCYSVQISWPNNRTPEEVQRAQSDQVTWRFKFRADA